ncbi:MAG TPA: hypothetical protein VMW25_01935 [Clostridia bacterium]|nr:hypothetical protein [Clostridia bacterium]
MKKLLVFIAFLGLLSSSTAAALAQNKAGINIAARHDYFGQAAEIVGPGGWIVVMACPGDGDKIYQWLEQYPYINLIIRGHFSPLKPDAKLAQAWANTLASILSTLPNPRKIYFVPWNEPNQVESRDFVPENELEAYITTLKQSFEQTGVLNKGVWLLSPSMNPSNPSFPGYVKNLGSGFFQQFHGIALSLYDTCNFCDNHYQNPIHSPQLLTEMGVAGKEIYGVESGTGGDFFYYKQAPDKNSFLYKFTNNFLKNSPYQVKMFALPAYDLGGEIGHSWNLFDPDDVTNLLKSAPDGSTTPAERIPFTPNLNLCPGRKHSFFVSSTSECDECGLGGEPFTLSTQENLICTDFKLIQSRISKEPTGVTPTPGPQALAAQTKEVTGNLELIDEALPDFSLMERNLYLGLNRLLPQALRQTLNLDSTPLETKIKHYVLGEEETEPVKIPESEVNLPSWWSRLLGLTKIACGLFNTCSPPERMNIKVAANVPEPPSYEIDCSLGGLAAKDSQVNQIESPETEFIAQGSFVTKAVEYIQELIEGIWQWFRQTTTEVTLVNKSRGKLPGGQTFNEQSSYLNYAIPGELVPKNENMPLAGQAKYEVDEDYQMGEGSEKLNYQQELARQRYCMERCSLRPQGISIQSFDPLCPSCSF